MATNPECRNKSRGVWLVKVPKYLSQKWREKAGMSQVGKLKIITARTTPTQQTTEVRFHSTIAPNDSLEAPTPVEHRLVVTGLNNQTLVVLNEDRPTVFDQIDEKPTLLSIEGKVVQRAECKPDIEDYDYKEMKKKLNQKTNRPENKVKSIEKAEIKFKPVSRHIEHTTMERAKRDNKNVRLEKNALLDLLFQAFEKHQYYKLTDLARVTAQPPNYLKETLQEIANYNTMPPHKYTWELKAEYRHYKGEEGMAQEI